MSNGYGTANPGGATEQALNSQQSNEDNPSDQPENPGTGDEWWSDDPDDTPTWNCAGYEGPKKEWDWEHLKFRYVWRCFSPGNPPGGIRG